MNPWGRLTKYTNNRERKNEKKRGNESKTLREALVALAGARIHVDKSKVAHKLLHIWTKRSSLTTWYVFYSQIKKHHSLHTAHARVTHDRRAQTWMVILIKSVPAQARQELWRAVQFQKRYLVDKYVPGRILSKKCQH